MNKFFQILNDKKKLIIKISCIVLVSSLAISGTIFGIYTYKTNQNKELPTTTESSMEIETTELETTELETTELETTELETTIEEETTTTIEEETTTEAEVMSEIDIQKTNEFFENSVFIGDSVMMGFRNYVMRQENILSNPEFLVSGSFSTRSALQDITEVSIHPMYQGKQRQIQESIQLMDVKKVFISLGLNDIGMQGVEVTVDLYDKLIQRILDNNPGIQVYIISTTYMLIGSEKDSLNNDLIREFNEMLKVYCEENEIGYIEIAESLEDENGGLAKEYCSDGYVHLTPAAYDIWTRLLREFALEETIEGEGL